LREAATFARDMVQYWAAVGNDLESTPNQLVSQTGSRVDGTGANPDNSYLWGLWRLQPGEALVIDVDPLPDAEFWNFYASNIWWEDLEERSRPMKVNSANAKSEDDGSLKIVLAATDPGYGNWVQTTGYPEGIMLLRATFQRSPFTVRSAVVHL
jgi:hypothetical protein